MHHFEQQSDTGVKINLLQKYLFVTLDNFNKIKHNKGKTIQLNNRLEAWLAFLIMDDPEDIVQILEQYPDFKVFYDQVYNIFLNIEEVMGMFSKELLELDRNTVELMIDEMQKEAEELKSQNESIKSQNESIKSQNERIKSQNERIKSDYEKLKKEMETWKHKYEELAQNM